MFSGEMFNGVLRAVSDAMRVPIVVILIVFMAAAVFLLGTLVVEFFTERARLKVKLPALADELRACGVPRPTGEGQGVFCSGTSPGTSSGTSPGTSPGTADGRQSEFHPDPGEIIAASGLLKRQKAVLLEVTRHPGLTPSMREALAVRLVREEREHYEGIVRVTDLLSRLGPMCGLLGTLIPLGPGIIALGRGDTYTLSMSLLTAFDTTVAGIIVAALTLVISAVRKKWYGGYMASLEMVMECLLETEEQR